MLLSIDPGTTFCGIAISHMEDSQLVIKYTESISINHLPKTLEDKADYLKYGARFWRIKKIIDAINVIVPNFDIDHIAIEGPFFNPGRPQAYAALVEVIYAIKSSVAYPNKLSTIIVEPLLVKKHFAHKHMAKKEDMMTALSSRLLDESISMSVLSSTLSEHEVDAVAVAFCYFHLIKELLSC